MARGTPQLTPQQLLDAGQRAEADGTTDVAAHFYRHLTDNYGYTFEAAEARNGLGRLGAAGQRPEIWRNGSAHHAGGESRSARLRNARRARYPAPRNYYRTGRALASLFSGIGWLIVAAGVAAPLIHFFMPVFVPVLVARYGFLGLLGGAAGSVLLGLLTVAMGQAARALFDQANATRELVALERTRLGAEQS
jgi:hypothetical protein